MALKKSELYSSLWSSCDELRGGMDASQYKDYVLVLLFIKYVSDKYAGVPYAPITIPPGSSFKDMVALKGKPDIGDQINKKIIEPLAKANKLSDIPDFNDATKLGSGKEMVERLTNLIAIFENKALDFSKNRADGDDILGDAYEYLMRHFATESGKSKGQFYTPAEVSRIIAQIIGIRGAEITSSTTVYDPTCGSGSLLLKVGDEAGMTVTLYGQEKDAATSGLARMNMILHNNPTALIVQGNTLADPKFKEGDTLKTFDYVVANPPFSDKRWSTGLDPLHDPYERFKPFGTPPGKQGDYAYLLHIVRSLKSTGKGACILPHGVLFRGNAEADTVLNEWLKLSDEEADIKKHLKDAGAALDSQAYAKYPKLSQAEIQTLVVEDKWLAALNAAIHGEMDRISQALTQRVTELAERYETAMPKMVDRVAELEAQVNRHLEKMGFSWN
jgi:type I restriction enzyme M protein